MYNYKKGSLRKSITCYNLKLLCVATIPSILCDIFCVIGLFCETSLFLLARYLNFVIYQIHENIFLQHHFVRMDIYILLKNRLLMLYRKLH